MRTELRKHLGVLVWGDCASHSTVDRSDSWPWSSDVAAASAWSAHNCVKRDIAGHHSHSHVSIAVNRSL